jgi:benzoyl-CoA reductase/2-hydroxyglutaryl-CoA dehydratase subunit BcrC/BadD/HgdB
MVSKLKPAGGSNRISTIIRTCKLLDRMERNNPETPPSHGIYYRMLIEYCSHILKSHEEGQFLAAHTVWFPVELLYALKIVPMHTEITAWMTALFSGNCADLLAGAAEVGIAPETCSPYRVLTGALAAGSLPHPNVILSSNLICDNNAKIGEVVRHLVKAPEFFLDCPFHNSAEENGYLKAELQSMISFLEEQSGHRMDWDRLNDSIRRMDRQLELYRQIDALRRTVPSPFIPADFLKLFTVDCLFCGEPEATEYLEALLAELQAKVAAGQGIAYPEKYRVLSIGLPPVLLQSAVEKVCREFGVVSVVDPFFCTWEDGRLDAPDPLDNVIRKINLYPSSVFYGPLTDKLTEKVVKTATDHKVDGAILYAHIGCRQTGALIKIIKDTLNAVNVPTLILDCDIIDVTVTPEEDLSLKLRQFFELLEDR